MTESMTAASTVAPHEPIDASPGTDFLERRGARARPAELAVILSTLVGSLTASAAPSPDVDNPTFAVTAARSLAMPLRSPASRSAQEADLVLESPRWMSGRVTALRARGFRRINDPRRA